MAVRFDSAAEGLRRDTNLPAVDGGWSMMVWLYRSADTGLIESPMSFGDVTPGYYCNCYIRAADNFIGMWGGNFPVYEPGTQEHAVGQWRHWCLRSSGTANIELAIDGVQYASGTLYSGVSAERVWIGTNVDSELFNGRAASYKCYSAYLTDANVALEMRQMLPVRTANLNTFLPLHNDATATTDYSGNGYTMTVNSGTLSTEDGPPIPWAMGRRRRVYSTAAAAFLPHSGPMVGQAVHRASTF